MVPHALGPNGLSISQVRISNEAARCWSGKASAKETRKPMDMATDATAAKAFHFHTVQRVRKWLRWEKD